MLCGPNLIFATTTKCQCRVPTRTDYKIPRPSASKRTELDSRGVTKVERPDPYRNVERCCLPIAMEK
jgi:hypothetical protein